MKFIFASFFPSAPGVRYREEAEEKVEVGVDVGGTQQEVVVVIGGSLSHDAARGGGSRAE